MDGRNGVSGPPPGAEGADSFRVLVVCTGNVCRSPAIGALLTADAEACGLRPRRWLQVRTAGVTPVSGAPVHPDTARALAALGVAVDDRHQARGLSGADVAWADLTVTACREHRSAAVRAHPPAVARAFTLLELARLVVPPGGAPAGTSVSPPAGRADVGGAHDWPALARRLVEQARSRRGLTPLTDPATLDLPDPIGRPASAHAAMVRQADVALRAILRALLTLGQLGAADPAAQAASSSGS